MQRSLSAFFRENGLTVVLMLLFAASVLGQMLAGWNVENQERMRHAQAALSLLAYLGGGQFLSTLFENWESEFLQMSAYVMLTVYFFQKGSAESREPPSKGAKSRRGRPKSEPERAWFERHRGALARQLYSHSLGIALGLLFFASFVLHWINSTRMADEEAVQHGEAAPGLLAHLGSSELWFESFQNWQSEFLSTAVLVVLTIFLREKGSPESKKVTDPDSKTGAS